MQRVFTDRTCRRLDIQGFEDVHQEILAEIAPWLRLAFGLCAMFAAVGTVIASPSILATLIPIAFLGAVLPVHPFDLIYNYGIRFFTGTPPLPRRGAPSRFACGLAVIFLSVTIWAFTSGSTITGYAVGGTMTAVAILVSTTDICIPSLIFRSIFGFPERRSIVASGSGEVGA